jgi:DNA-binding transcriptional ArsR family regulator
VNDPIYVNLDSEQVRTLAHPLRLRLLTALRTDGPSTATRLAERLDSNTGKTSYHLRVLADVGLVVEATDIGDERDRWWRAGHDVTHWDPEDHRADPDTAAAADWLRGAVARSYSERVEQWLRSRDQWSDEWARAADMSDLRIRLTPDRLRTLNDELLDVVRRYHATEDLPGATDAEPCTVIIQAFPDPHPET